MSTNASLPSQAASEQLFELGSGGANYKWRVNAAHVDMSAPGPAPLPLTFHAEPQTVTIDKGENDGRKLTYWNAVSDIQTAGMWHGKAQRYELPMSEITKKKGGCAVLLQSVGKDGLPGPILGAAVIHKPSL